MARRGEPRHRWADPPMARSEAQSRALPRCRGGFPLPHLPRRSGCGCVHRASRRERPSTSKRVAPAAAELASSAAVLAGSVARGIFLLAHSPPSRVLAALAPRCDHGASQRCRHSTPGYTIAAFDHPGGWGHTKCCGLTYHFSTRDRFKMAPGTSSTLRSLPQATTSTHGVPAGLSLDRRFRDPLRSLMGS